MINWVRNRQDRRKLARFPGSHEDLVLPVAVERRNAHSTLGQLVDLTQQGAKLCLDSVLQFSEQVILRLVLPSQDLSLEINSTILWTRASADGRFMVGCSFEKAIPDSVIDRLACLRLINRRRYPRFAADVQVEARWQLSTVAVPATIVDYSTGGFRMCCESNDALSQRVRLQLATGESVFGDVKWSSREGSKIECGCEFLRVSECVDEASIIARLAENPQDTQAIA